MFWESAVKVWRNVAPQKPQRDTLKTHCMCRDALKSVFSNGATQPGSFFRARTIACKTEKWEQKVYRRASFWFQGTISVLCLALSLTFLHPTARLDAMCWKAWHHYHWQTFSNKSPAFLPLPFLNFSPGRRKDFWLNVAAITGCWNPLFPPPIMFAAVSKRSIRHRHIHFMTFYYLFFFEMCPSMIW